MKPRVRTISGSSLFFCPFWAVERESEHQERPSFESLWQQLNEQLNDPIFQRDKEEHCSHDPYGRVGTVVVPKMVLRSWQRQKHHCGTASAW